MLLVGDLITVICSIDRFQEQQYVISANVGELHQCYLTVRSELLYPNDDYEVRVSLADEGRTWCRGHAGPAVDALHTVMALGSGVRMLSYSDTPGSVVLIRPDKPTCASCNAETMEASVQTNDGRRLARVRCGAWTL